MLREGKICNQDIRCEQCLEGLMFKPLNLHWFELVETNSVSEGLSLPNTSLKLCEVKYYAY